VVPTVCDCQPVIVWLRQPEGIRTAALTEVQTANRPQVRTAYSSAYRKSLVPARRIGWPGSGNLRPRRRVVSSHASFTQKHSGYTPIAPTGRLGTAIAPVSDVWTAIRRHTRVFRCGDWGPSPMAVPGARSAPRKEQSTSQGLRVSWDTRVGAVGWFRVTRPIHPCNTACPIDDVTTDSG
jgi:hypothetical protein